MTGLEDAESDRPQFFGETITDIINGEEMTYFPEEKRQSRDILATFVQFGFVSLVCIIVIGIYGLQWEILHLENANIVLTSLSLSSSAFALFNSIFIKIISKLCKCLRKYMKY